MFTVYVVFPNDKTTTLFTLWKPGSNKESKYGFGACIVTFYWYLSQLIVLLKPDFNCCKLLIYLSW